MASNADLSFTFSDLSVNLANYANAKKEFHDRYYDIPVLSKLTIEDFILYQKLGKGAFATVYYSTDKATKTEICALKVLRKEKILKEQQVDHVKSEKRLLNSVRSVFIIKLLHYFQDETYLYLAMEYMPGGELFRFLRARMYFGEDTAKFYSMQIILAIDYLHRLNIIYRDIKPENILISGTGYLKLADFGFAKLLLENRTYTLCGTPEYLAPETILNRGYGPAVDWWGIGVLIYELLCGHTPFYSPVIRNIYEKIVISKYKFPIHFTNESKSLIRHLLSLDTSKRLGNLKNRAEDVKNHRWFKSNNCSTWSTIYSQAQPLPSEIASNKNFEPVQPDDSSISTLVFEMVESDSSKNVFVDF